jgi:hypothetical protein
MCMQSAALCNALQSNFIWFPCLCFGIVLGTPLGLGWLRCCNIFSLVWARLSCAGNEEKSESTGGPKFRPGYFECKETSRNYTVTHVCLVFGVDGLCGGEQRAEINVSGVTNNEISPHVACHVACILERYCVRACVRHRHIIICCTGRNCR